MEGWDTESSIDEEPTDRFEAGTPTIQTLLSTDGGGPEEDSLSMDADKF